MHTFWISCKRDIINKVKLSFYILKEWKIVPRFVLLPVSHYLPYRRGLVLHSCQILGRLHNPTGLLRLTLCRDALGRHLNWLIQLLRMAIWFSFWANMLIQRTIFTRVKNTKESIFKILDYLISAPYFSIWMMHIHWYIGKYFIICAWCMFSVLFVSVKAFLSLSGL